MRKSSLALFSRRLSRYDSRHMNFLSNNAVSLILAGFLALFLELALIRWLPANILALAYFSNLVLISAFVGLGIGFLLPSSVRERLHYFPVILFLVVSLSILMRLIQPVIPRVPTESMWSFYGGNFLALPRISLNIIPTLALTFVLNALPFVLIGDLIGRLMRSFKPLTAYALDIFGSILGILAFTVFAFLGEPLASPVVWFALAGVISLWFIRTSRRALIVGIVCTVTLSALVFYATKSELWSPYYHIDITFNSGTASTDILVNQFFFQSMVDFETNHEAREKYEFPYTFIKPDRVLILGAGSGNDVAMAARQGVPHIDAVEIDARIAAIGKERHPGKPYDNPQVRLHIDDARSFLAKHPDTYDFIVLGTLDSHALLSARSTVRLDNFVYTQESLRSIKAHLTDDGVVALLFSVPESWISDKIVKSVQSVFGAERTVVLTGGSYLFNLVVLTGPGVEDLIRRFPETFQASAPVSSLLVPDESVSTDDWPYLYLKTPGVSAYYLQAIGVLLAASCITLFMLLRKRATDFFRYESGVFFLLGVGFLLLETKSITTLSLVFGSTWIVNSFVFASILLMVLLANTVISRFSIPVGFLYIGVVATILMNYVIPVSVFLAMPLWSGYIAASLMVALPIFFASMAFSTHFKSVSDIRIMYGLNLMGAVCGGFLEYTAMLTGMNALYLLAIGVYILAFVLYKQMNTSA